MTDLRENANSSTPSKMPLWVKMSGIILIVLLLLLGIMQIAGFKHGPGLHNPSGAHSTEQP